MKLSRLQYGSRSKELKGYGPGWPAAGNDVARGMIPGRAPPCLSVTVIPGELECPTAKSPTAGWISREGGRRETDVEGGREEGRGTAARNGSPHYHLLPTWLPGSDAISREWHPAWGFSFFSRTLRLPRRTDILYILLFPPPLLSHATTILVFCICQFLFNLSFHLFHDFQKDWRCCFGVCFLRHFPSFLVTVYSLDSPLLFLVSSSLPLPLFLPLSIAYLKYQRQVQEQQKQY